MNTRVTHRNIFQRVGSAMCGALIGLLLFVLAFPVLWYNEQAAVKSYASLAEAKEAVLPIDATFSSPVNNGRLVHLSASVNGEEMQDRDWGVRAKGVQMSRHVEMLQWVERKDTRDIKDNFGNVRTETTYHYDLEWRNRPVDSSYFDDPNYHNPGPSAWPASSKVVSNPRVTVGGFQLSANQKQSLSSAPVDVTDPNHSALAVLAPDYNPPPFSNPNIPTRALVNSLGAVAKKAQLHDGAIVLARHDVANPSVGDVRLTYSHKSPDVVSLMGMQDGDRIVPFQTGAGDAIELVADGHKTALQMIEIAEGDVGTRTWAYRGGGWLLMAIGIGLVLNPASVVPEFVPFIGSFVGSLVGCGIFMFAIVSSLALSLVVIALGWLRARPLVSLTLLAVAGGLWWSSSRTGFGGGAIVEAPNDRNGSGVRRTGPVPNNDAKLE